MLVSKHTLIGHKRKKNKYHLILTYCFVYKLGISYDRETCITMDINDGQKGDMQSIINFLPKLILDRSIKRR